MTASESEIEKRLLSLASEFKELQNFQLAHGNFPGSPQNFSRCESSFRENNPLRFTFLHNAKPTSYNSAYCKQFVYICEYKNK